MLDVKNSKTQGVLEDGFLTEKPPGGCFCFPRS